MNMPVRSPVDMPAEARIRTWFSLRSPYSYLGLHKALKAGLPLHLVATWPTGEVRATSTPERMNYLIEDCLRLFAEERIPFAPPVEVTSWIRPHAAFHVAAQAGKGEAFALRAYKARWSESRDLGAPETIRSIADEVGVDGEAAMSAMDDRAVHHALWAIRREFEADQVIGVPFFVYGGQRFWGQDRIDALINHVRQAHGTSLGAD